MEKRKCEYCDGKGYIKCTVCSGSGNYRGITIPLMPNMFYPSIIYMQCGACKGKGRITCSKCNGTGEVENYEK